MERLRWWLLLVAAVMFSMSGCTSVRDWSAWLGHPAHFASADHLVFSMRNEDPEYERARPVVTERDRKLAEDQAWWGSRVPAMPPADLSGHWVGSWKGLGLFESLRQAPAEATMVQQGRIGVAHLRLEDTIAAHLPWRMRYEGSRGVRLVYRVSGADAWMRHPEAPGQVTAAFTLVDDYLVGTLPGMDGPVVITLARQSR